MLESGSLPLVVARSELIVGGQKSGKSRRAEMLARSWLAGAAGRHAVLVATARRSDEEMGARIERHRRDRACRVPTMATIEEPLEIAAAIGRHTGPEVLLVVDCLTLWLTNLLWADHGRAASAPVALADAAPASAALLEAIGAAAGPIVLVSNEIGLGVIPMGREVRAFVDALGQLNQQVAHACQRVTLMAAGLPLGLKDAA